MPVGNSSSRRSFATPAICAMERPATVAIGQQESGRIAHAESVPMSQHRSGRWFLKALVASNYNPHAAVTGGLRHFNQLNSRKTIAGTLAPNCIKNVSSRGHGRVRV